MSTLHLSRLLNPRSIVVIGASTRETSAGLDVVRNLLQGNYQGKLFLVNPRYQNVLGEPCYPSLKALPETPDLALILTPARLLKRTLVQCARRGTKVAIVMSGADNAAYMHHYAQRLGLRILGPYCAGLIRPHLGINASYNVNRIAKGSLAIVSQSASLSGAMLDWAETSGVGFSALLSTGSDTDITLADLLDLLAEDYQTRAVIVYLDTVNSTRSLLSALSATARIKPVVLMKSTQAGARYCDALTRTGHVHSSDHVFQAALSRAGVVRIRTFSNLFSAAKMLASGMRTKGDRVAIVSNGAAPAMLAFERIEIKGFSTPQFRGEALQAMKRDMEKGSHEYLQGNNPFVLRSPARLLKHYHDVIDSLRRSDEVDAILVLFVPDSRNDATLVAEALIDCLPSSKPILVCFMGDASVAKARELLSSAGVAHFRTPEAAADSFDFLHRYYVSQQQLLQLPDPSSGEIETQISQARELIVRAMAKGVRVLGPQLTQKLLSLFGMETLKSRRATTLEKAIEAAQQIGFPVAMKLVSPNISYKASVVSTQLSIMDTQGVHEAWNMIEQALKRKRPDAQFRGVLVEEMHQPKNRRDLAIGISRDATFGPVLNVGIGGDLTPLLLRRTSQLPPLNDFLIDELLSTPVLRSYFGEFRHNEALDMKRVAKLLRQLSELSTELPEVFTLDMNPVRISKDRIVAVDVQVVLEKPFSRKRYSHLAIHPYPAQWIRTVTLKNKTNIKLRPIRPEDAKSIQALVRGMSAESRFYRFMHAISELTPQMTAQFTKLDYDRQMAFVADAENHAEGIVGVSRYIMSSDKTTGEFAVSLSDDWQEQGLAKQLMSVLIEHARYQGLSSIHGDVLRTNSAMRKLMKAMEFKAHKNPDDPETMIFEYQLEEPE